MIDLEEFFETPLSTSVLKYRILHNYLREYFHKVNNNFHCQAIAADLFAGMGRFKTGEEGSPIIIAKYAKIARRIYGYENQVYLAEADPKIQSDLFQNVKDFILDGVVEILPGEATDAGGKLLEKVQASLPLFIFLDPCGTKGLSINLLEKVLERAQHGSTEFLINLNHSAIDRHIGRVKHLDSSELEKCRPARISAKILGQAFGEGMFREILMNDEIPEEAKGGYLRDRYINNLRNKIRYLGIFPVTGGFPDEHVKYDLIFGTRSPTAFYLMNDAMRHALDEFIEILMRKYDAGTLFESGNPSEFIPQKYKVDDVSLRKLVYNECVDLTRLRIELNRGILKSNLINKNFAKYSNSDYNRVIRLLLKQQHLRSKSGRLMISDDEPIFLASLERI